jgi:superfamily I DNA/RNA helicase
METLLVPLAELRSGVDARGRLVAAKRAEAFVLNQFDWPTGNAAETREQQIELLAVEPEQIRMIVSKLLAASRQWPDKKACSTSVRGLLEEFASDLPVSLSPSLGQRLVVQDKVWKFWESRTEGMFETTNVDSIRWTHIHGVKGDEFDGVVLAIPATATGAAHVLDDWAGGLNSEQRRVFYVGASRARKVLVLVVPKVRQDQLLAILSAAGVPHVCSTC